MISEYYHSCHTHTRHNRKPCTYTNYTYHSHKHIHPTLTQTTHTPPHTNTQILHTSTCTHIPHIPLTQTHAVTHISHSHKCPQDVHHTHTKTLHTYHTQTLHTHNMPHHTQTYLPTYCTIQT